jgi:uncharacterized protein
VRTLTIRVKGWTPVYYAALNGHASTVKLLKERGARLNIKTKDKKTAIDTAREKGHTDVIAVLKG